MRNISFSMTTQQFIDGTKTVTRRLGWTFLKPGDRLCAVEKAMGLKKGEKVRRLGIIEVVSVQREILSKINMNEVQKEGFPSLYPNEFVEMFCKHMNCSPFSTVTRIEFKKINPPLSADDKERM